MPSSREHIEITERFSAHNYGPLDVVISSAEGVWVTDIEGHRYLDLLSSYSALNFGHRNARITKVAHAQLDRLTLTSRAFYNDQLGLLCRDLAKLAGLDSVLLMNSGAEAVETAIKAARRWGYDKKKIAAEQAEIIVFTNNFHGRTTTLISASTSPEYQRSFGPFTPGFVVVSYGDLDALEAAINPNTAAIIVEPIQGEAGIIIPPEGFLRGIRKLCDRKQVLFIADEIQTGLCRTGAVFACDHEGVKPDAYLLAKSLGGGIVPISAFIAKDELMQVFDPGSHGSTFGGNPFACAIAREVLAIIDEERPHEYAREIGEWFVAELRKITSPAIRSIRARGLLIGVDIDPRFGKAKVFIKKLKDQGLLCKDTREQTLRIAPPLTITREELSFALEGFRRVFEQSAPTN